MSRERLLGRRLVQATRTQRHADQLARAVRRALTQSLTPASHTLTAAIELDLGAWDDDLDEVVSPVIDAILQDVVDGTLSFMKLEPEQRARVLGGVDLGAKADEMRSLIRNLGVDASNRLAQQLQFGVARGEGERELAARVGGVLDVETHRAEMIARTEVHRAGIETGFEAAGTLHEQVPLRKTWLSASDDRVRDDHADADGQTVAYDDAFDVGGESLDYPGDPSGSPENTINCRCDVLYDTADDTEDGDQHGQPGGG